MNTNKACKVIEVDGATQPLAVPDIDSWLLFNKSDGNIYCVGSLSQDKYISVPASKLDLTLEIISRFDGRHSIAEIQEYYRREAHKDVDATQLCILLRDAGLLVHPKPHQIHQSEFKRFSITLLSLDLTRIYRALGSTALRFRIPLIIATLATIVIGMVNFPSDIFSSESSYQVGESYGIGFAVLVAAMLFAAAAHEFSHGLVATWYGLIPKRLKIALYLGFMLFLYLEIPGIYTIRRWQRVKIWLAGVYINIFISCSLLIFRTTLAIDPVTDAILMKIVIANFLLVAGNLLPFAPTDGYFLLCTLLKVANLRTRALDQVKNWLTGQGTRLRVPILIYLVLSLLVVLNALRVQIRWLIGMAMELYHPSSDTSIAEYAFTALLMTGFVLAPFIRWFQRRQWLANSKCGRDFGCQESN